VSTEAGERTPPPRRAAPPRPFAAIALGFLALALPLFVAVGLSESATGAWTNAAAGAVFVLLGALLWTRRG
jgi:hypothetical protein